MCEQDTFNAPGPTDTYKVYHIVNHADCKLDSVCVTNSTPFCWDLLTILSPYCTFAETEQGREMEEPKESGPSSLNLEAEAEAQKSDSVIESTADANKQEQASSQDIPKSPSPSALVQHEQATQSEQITQTELVAKMGQPERVVPQSVWSGSVVPPPPPPQNIAAIPDTSAHEESVRYPFIILSSHFSSVFKRFMTPCPHRAYSGRCLRKDKLIDQN